MKIREVDLRVTLGHHENNRIHFVVINPVQSMKTSATFLVLTMITVSFSPETGFLSEQKKFSRVRAAIEEKEETISQKLTGHGLKLDNFHVLFTAYKDTDEFDVYVREKTGSTFKRLVSYEICSRSGQLGPKRKEGDLQVPEGFYRINMFNPTSNFHLSLGINYPNLSDKRKSKHPKPGGNIFIHGACVTIGCLPMTNERIKEIYLYAVHAKNNGQINIPVYIFPFRMKDDDFNRYKATYSDNGELIDFWSNLKTGYDKFLKDPKELRVTVDPNGDYLF